MDQDLQHLAQAYFDEPTPRRREAVVLGSVPLVRSLLGRIPVPNHPLASREDLESAGLLGLLQALDTYDPARGAAFVTHAYRRVRGAIVDYLRGIDVLPQGRRRKLSEAQQAAETLRQMLGHEPQDQDVADYLGISLRDYHGLLTDAQRRFALSLHKGIGDDGDATLIDVLPDDSAEEGFEAVDRSLAMEAVEKAIPSLPERQQTILALYYYEGLTLREIGEVLGLTEARISQLLGKTMLALRATLTAVIEPTPVRAAA